VLPEVAKRATQHSSSPGLRHSGICVIKGRAEQLRIQHDHAITQPNTVHRQTCRSELAIDLRDLAEPSDFLRLFILAILFFMDLFIFPSIRSPATPCSMTVESFGDGGGSWREAAAAVAARALAPAGSGGLPMSTNLPGMSPKFTCTVGTASCSQKGRLRT